MGATFSNIHIKKNDTLQQRDTQDYCVQMMKETARYLDQMQEQ